MRMERSPAPAALKLFRDGTALAEAGHLAKAVAPLVECLRQSPQFGSGFVNLAYVLHRLGALDQALVMARAGADLLPESMEASHILAAVLLSQGDFLAALQVYAAIPFPHKDHPATLIGKGLALRAMGRLDEALAVYASAIAAAPDNAEAHFNYAEALLVSGDFERGWSEYEWRWRRRHARPRPLGTPWAGDALAGRTILLHAEQGYGDTLQFVRYAPMVAALGGKVVLEVPPPLLRLMQSVPGVDQLVVRGGTLPPYDVHCPLLSLPHLFKTSLGTIPAATPYLHPDPTAVTAWRAVLPPDGQLRVGLVWAGSPHRTEAGVALIDARRSVPLSCFAPLGGVAGIHFISLQTGAPAEALRHPPPGLTVTACLSDSMDFADTAALIATLDLVISVDTAVAHLAGALHCPVWVLSRLGGCWRWLETRDDSPWYPSLRLYRQTHATDWTAVISQVRRDLEEFRPGQSRP